MSAIDQLIQPRTEDLGEFSVRRMLPNAKCRAVGPWVFFDHMGPADFPAGPGINVRPHPHINLATVTYLFEGEILHRDSLGCEQAIRPGDINLMVAGSGIVHSERERPEMMESDRRLHGLQLWLALPEADEETPPEFLHYPSNDIPALTLNEVPVRVMLGSAYGVTSPVKTFAETLYVEATLQAGQRLSIPDVDERAVYVAGGEVEINGELVPEFALATLDTASGLEIIAKQPSRIAIIGGENIGHRYVWWNFVSSRKQRIEQAKQDWAEGRFPLVPGDDAEFIPLPEK
ncbi:pirin family protein [Leucothrix mucor]|uniref:pirin family protein n=1 Tax=Leucothrix mucor TaxID=45248 RepID=UPI0003B3D25E|nr:pirin family protein [Leucothrix mucor]